MSGEETKKAEIKDEKIVKKESSITSGASYRETVGKIKEVDLPSGAVFKIRRLTPMDYIKKGLADIPNEFFKFIAELTSGKMADPKSEETKKNYEVFEKFLTITIECGIIEPLVLFKYDKKAFEEKGIDIGATDAPLLFGELTQKDQNFLIDAISGKIEI